MTDVNTWTGPTNYTPAPGEDPEWDAYVAEYLYRKQKVAEDSKLSQGTTATDYADALRKLEEGAISGRRSIDTNALARGVYQSGEVVRRRDDLGTQVTNAKTAADGKYAETLGRILAGERDAATSLDLTREQQIAASRNRVAERKRLADEGAAAVTASIQNAATSSSGASGGGAVSTPYASLPPQDLPPAASSPRPVDPTGQGFEPVGAGQGGGPRRNPTPAPKSMAGTGRGSYGPVRAPAAQPKQTTRRYL